MPDPLGARRHEGSEHELVAPCVGRVLTHGGIILVERRLKTAVEAKRWVEWAMHDYAQRDRTWRIQIIDATGALREFEPSGKTEAPISE